MLRSLALLLLAAPFASAAPVPQAVKNDDELAILGTWKMTVRSHFAREDTSVSREILWRLEAEGRGALVDGSVTEFKFKLLPAESPKSPKSFDYIMTTGTLAGVYKLDGDTLRVTIPGELKLARPIVLGPAKEVYHWEFQRVKPEKK